MEATLTQLQRQAGRVAQAIARRETVRLTRHGEMIAEIEPRTRGMSGAEFAARGEITTPLDKATCDEGIAALKKLESRRMKYFRRLRLDSCRARKFFLILGLWLFPDDEIFICGV